MSAIQSAPGQPEVGPDSSPRHQPEEPDPRADPFAGRSVILGVVPDEALDVGLDGYGVDGPPVLAEPAKRLHVRVRVDVEFPQRPLLPVLGDRSDAGQHRQVGLRVRGHRGVELLGQGGGDLGSTSMPGCRLSKASTTA